MSAKDYDYRRFDEIPNGSTFADKFGRIYTKTSVGSATEHGEYNDDGLYNWVFDESREYLEGDDDELEECDMWEAYPFYALPHVAAAGRQEKQQ